MSDVDRLRAAADRLDNYADQREAEGGSALWIGQDRTTAALLRAIAEEFYYYNVSVSGIKDAAFALADSILGGTDD